MFYISNERCGYNQYYKLMKRTARKIFLTAGLSCLLVTSHAQHFLPPSDVYRPDRLKKVVISEIAISTALSVGLYGDVHLPGPVVLQLRLRKVDIVTATESGTNRLTDEDLLHLSTPMNRIMVTQDIRFRVLAEGWQRSSTFFSPPIACGFRSINLRS